jgi:hypothetical protein
MSSNDDGNAEVMEEVAEEDTKSSGEPMEVDNGEDPTKYSQRTRDKLLQDVCLSAKIAGGLARGLRSVVKKLEK